MKCNHCVLTSKTLFGRNFWCHKQTDSCSFLKKNITNFFQAEEGTHGNIFNVEIKHPQYTALIYAKVCRHLSRRTSVTFCLLIGELADRGLIRLPEKKGIYARYPTAQRL